MILTHLVLFSFLGGAGGAVSVEAKTGTGGIDPPRIYKPTGLGPRKKLTVPKRVEPVAVVREVQTVRVPEVVRAVESMSTVEIHAEISELMQAKLREEEEIVLFLLIAAL